jgi:hypothetical protein
MLLTGELRRNSYKYLVPYTLTPDTLYTRQNIRRKPYLRSTLGSYTLHPPHHILSAHFLFEVDKLIELGAVDDGTGDGSRQIPIQSLEVQLVLVCDTVVCLAVELGFAVVEDLVAGSLQPSHPGVLQVLVLPLAVGDDEVVLIEGAGARLGLTIVVDDVVVMVLSSLHPNQPGVLQVVVVITVDDMIVVVGAEVVLSSKHPHQPGVLHVSVRVLVLVLVLEALLLVVVSLLLLSKNFQLKQSWHSTSSSQLGTVSYFSITSLITLLMRWVPSPTRHPRSLTVS